LTLYKLSMKSIKRLLIFARPIHHFLPEYLIYTFWGILFGLLNFTMLIPILNTLFGINPGTPVTHLPEFSFSIGYFADVFNYYFHSITAKHGKLSALGFVCIVVGCSTILANIFRYLAVRVLMRLRLKMLENIRVALFSKLTHQSLSFYHRSKKGELLSVLSSEVQEVESSVINSLQSWLRDPFMIIAYFIALFYMSAKLTLFTIIFFPISGIIVSYISKRLKSISWFSQDLLGKILNFSDESLNGIKVIQSYASENFMIKKFRELNRAFSKNSKTLFVKRELASPVSEILSILLFLGLVMYGGYLVLNNDGGLSGATFIGYLALYSQIIQPAKNLSSTTTLLQRGIVATEKIFSILDEPVAITEAANAQSKQSFKHKIEFKNVDFRYETNDVLKNINLTIEKGKKIALIGQSGSGKSTLADLIPRFYDPVQGAVLIDGINVKDIKLNDLRSLICVVSQETILFNDTVLNNISFASNNANITEVEKAAQVAHANQFIEQMEEGYNSSIGDRGQKLSGGQRQRLSIARAVYKNPPILILDEATSALDTESEKLVQDALDTLMKERTSIIIAHRLSTVRNADEIIVLNKGVIVERGSHQELIQQNGEYKKLVELQEIK
jgi:ATP-binding cassette, subfamily B, bacterial MsbA